MAAVTFLLQPPPLFSLSSCRLGFIPLPKQSLNCLFRAHPSQKSFTVRASASKNTRKKVKSNAELCTEIREFLASVGLPEDHVPSTKELLHHGRNELAYIVRRRGHKLLKELLPNSKKADIDDVDTENSLTGQDEKVSKTVEVVSSSTEVSLGGSSPSIDLHLNSIDNVGMSIESPSDLTNDPYLNSIDRDGMSIELPTSSLEEDSSNTLNGHEEEVNNAVEGNSFSTKGLSVEKYLGSLNIVDSDLTQDSDFKPQEVSVSSSFEENASYNLQNKDEKASSISQDVSSSTEVSAVDFSPSSKIDGMGIESSASLSLKEKVAKFVQNGELDLVEEDVQESKGIMKQDEVIGVKPMSVAEENNEYVLAGAELAVPLNGSISMSNPVQPHETANHHLRDDQNLSKGLEGADSAKNLDETISNEDQAEINHLKLMLHQKELELAQLKEQIEKEKLALSVLQTKVETEINKAQEIIHEKDVELHAVEENLSGLEEVEIQYSGDGELVEVAGSFNGWHHKIKLDPVPASDSNDPAGSRKSKLWSTVLWLYPGKYEIKFIVDGQWRIDPQRETVTRGTICNNILQVHE